MPFPKTARVIYNKNPLKLVLCQLRFPAILRIGKEAPADFQEKLRHEFPLFQEANDTANSQLPENLAQIIPPDMLDLLSTRSNPRFQFMTKDKAWIISLTRDFVALETSQYTCWEEFRDYLELILQALVEIYAPAFLTRIGLRYQNVIDRRALGLEDVAWHDLLADFVLGQLALNEMLNKVTEQHGGALIRLDSEGDLVRIQHGLVRDNSANSPDIMYLLDYDFHTERETEAGVQNVISKFNEYNKLNRRLFRWCIRETLHKAMGPEST